MINCLKRFVYWLQRLLGMKKIITVRKKEFDITGVTKVTLQGSADAKIFAAELSDQKPINGCYYSDDPFKLLSVKKCELDRFCEELEKRDIVIFDMIGQYDYKREYNRV